MHEAVTRQQTYVCRCWHCSNGAITVLQTLLRTIVYLRFGAGMYDKGAVAKTKSGLAV